MKSYEYEVTIMEIHYIDVSAETAAEANRLAYEMARACVPDKRQVVYNILSVEEEDD